jgi:hypothetical protein
MENIPVDILNKINELFPNIEDNSEAKKLIEQIFKSSINIGPSQLARSILFISNGNLSLIKKIIDSDFYGDPRDVIMEAEQKAGNPGHYFNLPFTQK